MRVKRVDMVITNEQTGERFPARFYARDNDINKSVLKGLSKSLFSSKYGFTKVAGVKLSDVINPETKEPAVGKIYKDGKEIEVPIKQLNSFSTGYDREAGEVTKDTPYIINLQSVMLEGVNKDGKKFNMTKIAYRDNEKKGELKNFEAFKALKEAIEKSPDGMSVVVEIDEHKGKDGKTQLYIKKFEPVEEKAVEKEVEGGEVDR